MFENSVRPIIAVGNKKKNLSILAISALLHFGLAIILFFSSITPINRTPVPTSPLISIFITSESFSSPPPLLSGPRADTKKSNDPIHPIERKAAPIEIPTEIKPEPESSGTSSTTTSSDKNDSNNSITDGISGGDSNGTPDVISGGIANGIKIGSATQGPVRPGGNIREPKRIKYVHPDYPETARLARIEGVVVIEAIIGKDGKIKNTKVIRSIPILDEAALEAVKKWQYQPTYLHGQAIEIILLVNIKFELTK